MQVWASRRLCTICYNLFQADWAAAAVEGRPVQEITDLHLLTLNFLQKYHERGVFSLISLKLFHQPCIRKLLLLFSIVAKKLNQVEARMTRSHTCNKTRKVLGRKPFVEVLECISPLWTAKDLLSKTDTVSHYSDATVSCAMQLHFI